jgi:DNA-binding response OmpR family regulator
MNARSAHIAILEDEPDLLELEEYHLRKAGYTVTGLLSAKYARRLLEEESIDLMIVDRNLPCIEGSEFIAALREEGVEIPVIFVSAKDRPDAIEEGFKRGGDDYLTKPFDMNELLWRIEAILRRTRRGSSQIVRYRDIVLDASRHTVLVGDKQVDVSRLEFDLLHYFLRHPDTPLSRAELLEKVWGDRTEAKEATVNVTVNRLVSKIDPERTRNYIEPVRGIGYRLCR